MRILVLSLACFTSACHGRRVQSKESYSSKQSGSSRNIGANVPLKALADSLLAVEPKAGWHASLHRPPSYRTKCARLSVSEQQLCLARDSLPEVAHWLASPASLRYKNGCLMSTANKAGNVGRFQRLCQWLQQRTAQAKQGQLQQATHGRTVASTVLQSLRRVKPATFVQLVTSACVSHALHQQWPLAACLVKVVCRWRKLRAALVATVGLFALPCGAPAIASGLGNLRDHHISKLAFIGSQPKSTTWQLQDGEEVVEVDGALDKMIERAYRDPKALFADQNGLTPYVMEDEAEDIIEAFDDVRAYQKYAPTIGFALASIAVWKLLAYFNKREETWQIRAKEEELELTGKYISTSVSGLDSVVDANTGETIKIERNIEEDDKAAKSEANILTTADEDGFDDDDMSGIEELEALLS